MIVLVGVGLSFWMVRRNVVNPILGIADGVDKLAAGNFAVVLPGLGRKDEIGRMAQAVETFKSKAIERAGREAAEKEAAASAIASARRTEMHELANGFEAAVGVIVHAVATASSELEAAASSLTDTAESTHHLTAAVASASEQASSNVQLLAAATQELSASVREIGSRVQESSVIADEAVRQAQMTDARITELVKAASHIGDVVKLITAIAGQTNLLALNATIEAARAGEAGKGFVVVAREVKTLSAETAKATDGIAAQIATMQIAIREVGGCDRGDRRYDQPDLGDHDDDRRRNGSAGHRDRRDRAQCRSGGARYETSCCEYCGRESRRREDRIGLNPGARVRKIVVAG